MKASLRTLIAQGIDALRAAGTLPADLVAPGFAIERPKGRLHGDFSTNAAMLLAKAARINPRTLADALVAALPADPRIAKVETAGPGFINFDVTPQAYQREIVSILEAGAQYGRNCNGAGHTVGIEFVSANPTGPLHVGHGRAAAIGDCLARVLDANGWKVVREFYYNDTGAQIDNLAKSVQARAQGKTPDDDDWPVDGYRGDYIIDVAEAYLRGETIENQSAIEAGAKDPADFDAIRSFAVAYLRRQQNSDLAAFGVSFDVYFLESSLYADGLVDQAVHELTAQGHIYEKEGALWLRSTDYGDDKDRVMRKSDGSFTYFVPDIAYHRSKWERGYERAITELGADHHGSLARVRAGLRALNIGIPQGWPEYVIHQMVTVMRDSKEVKLSKRAGSYLTLSDLIEEVGRDATRWFLIARKSDSQLIFDIDLARSRSNENPLYYVQYAHARICSLLRQAGEKGYTFDVQHGLAYLGTLTDGHAKTLLQELSRYPEVIETAAETLEPHAISQYLREVASYFHAWYHAQPIVVEDATDRDSRLALSTATGQVLRNGLNVLGLSAPEVM